MRDIALNYALARHAETVLDVPITHQELQRLMLASRKITAAYFYHDGCRVSSWSVIFNDFVNISRSVTIIEGLPLLPMFNGSIDVLAQRLQRAELCVTFDILRPTARNSFPIVVLDVASMSLVFQHRAEEFPSLTSLAQQRTRRFLDDVIEFYRDSPIMLAEYLRESITAIGVDVPRRGVLSPSDDVAVLSALAATLW